MGSRGRRLIAGGLMFKDIPEEGSVFTQKPAEAQPAFSDVPPEAEVFAQAPARGADATGPGKPTGPADVPDEAAVFPDAEDDQNWFLRKAITGIVGGVDWVANVAGSTIQGANADQPGAESIRTTGELANEIRRARGLPTDDRSMSQIASERRDWIKGLVPAKWRETFQQEAGAEMADPWVHPVKFLDAALSQALANVGNMAAGFAGRSPLGIAMAAAAMADQEAAGYADTWAKQAGLPIDFVARYAKQYGLLSAPVEYAQNAMFAGKGGLARGGKALALRKGLTILKSKPMRALLAAADISLEGVQEVGQGLIENLVARRMVQDWNQQNPDAQLAEPPAWSNEAAWQQFKAGAGMGIIYKVAGGAGGKLRNMAKAKGPAAGPSQGGAFEPAVEAQPVVEQPAQPVAPVQQPAAAQPAVEQPVVQPPPLPGEAVPVVQPPAPAAAVVQPVNQAPAAPAPVEVGVPVAIDPVEVNAEPAQAVQGLDPENGAAIADATQRGLVVNNFPLEKIQFDPGRFQYKLAPGQSGQTGSLKGVRKYDPVLGGVLLVWRDPADNKTYVVNGHNRAAKANELGVKDHAVRFIAADDDVSARAVGALVNIAEGHGNALDAAKFFRDSGYTAKQAADKGLPISGTIVKKGLALSALDQTVFNSVVQGDMPEAIGVAIGSSGLDHSAQRALAGLIERAGDRKLDAQDVAELAIEVQTAPTVTVDNGPTLFQFDDRQENLAIERARIVSAINRRLSADKRLFQRVSTKKAATRLAAAGNQIDIETNRKVSEDAAVVQEVFNRLRKTADVTTVLNQAAEGVYNGQSITKAVDQAYNGIRTAVSEALGKPAGGELERVQAAGAAGSGEAGAGAAAAEAAAKSGAGGQGPDAGLVGEAVVAGEGGGGRWPFKRRQQVVSNEYISGPVFHGTSATFERFNNNRMFDNDALPKGIFFTSDEKIAGEFADLRNSESEMRGAKRVIKSVLKYKNPLIIDASGKNSTNVEWDFGGEIGPIKTTTQIAFKAFSRKGYDAVIFKNIFDQPIGSEGGYGFMRLSDLTASTVYAVKNADQVKLMGDAVVAGEGGGRLALPAGSKPSKFPWNTSIDVNKKINDVPAGMIERVIKEAKRLEVAINRPFKDLLRQMNAKYGPDETIGRLRLIGVSHLVDQPTADSRNAEVYANFIDMDKMADYVTGKTTALDLETRTLVNPYPVTAVVAGEGGGGRPARAGAAPTPPSPMIAMPGPGTGQGPGGAPYNRVGGVIDGGGGESGGVRLRLRGLLETLKDSPMVADSSKQDLAKLDPMYEKQRTEQIKDKVLRWMTNSPVPNETKARVDEAEMFLRDTETDLDYKGAVGVALLEHYRNTGNDKANLELVEYLDPVMRGAGRLIQAARMLNGMTGNNWIKKLQKYLADRGVKLPKPVQAEIEQGFRDAAKIRDATARAQAIHALIEKATPYVPFRAGEWLDAYRYSNMLSNPQSHERNVYGNMVQALITRPLSLIGRGEIVGAGKYVGPAFRSMLNGEALFAARESLRDDFSKWVDSMDNPNATIFDAIRRDQGPQGKGAAVAWKALTAIPKLLQAQDAFFGAMIEAGETARLMENGVHGPEAQAVARRLSEKYLYRTRFGNVRDASLPWASQALDGLANLLEKGRAAENPFVGWPMKVAVPFLRTPMRIAQFGVEASPLAWLGTGMNRNSIARAEFGKPYEQLSGEAKTIVTNELQNRIGMASIGTMISLMGVGFAILGRTTWGPPDDEKERELFYASGRRPYSFMAGGKWIPMSYLGPFFLAFALPAAARNAFAEDTKLIDKSFIEKLASAAAGIPKIIVSQTPTSGVNGLLEMLQGKADRTFSRNAGFQLGQFIPASGLLRWMTKVTDPVYRRPVTVAETIAAGIPGLSEDLKAYKNQDGSVTERDWTDLYLPYTAGTAVPGADTYASDIMDRERRKILVAAVKPSATDEQVRAATRVMAGMKTQERVLAIKQAEMQQKAENLMDKAQNIGNKVELMRQRPDRIRLLMGIE